MAQHGARARQVTVSEPVLRAEGLTKDYPGGRHTRRALDGVDLEVHAGRVVALVGPSGSGKSTLLHLLGALDTPTSGAIWLDGRRVDALDERARTELRRTRIGFVFQQFNLIPVLTAFENVALPLVITQVPERERRRRVEAMLELVALPAVVHDQRPAELSGGEQQRVAIARALVTEPAIVLADEPTGALDSDSGREVLRQIRVACHELGRGVVLATHDLAAASRADEIVRLRDGRVVERMVPREGVDLGSVFETGDGD